MRIPISSVKLHRIANDPLIEDAAAAAIIVKEENLDINYQHPRTGQTALMSATLGGKATIVEVLLTAGADPLVPEKDGKEFFCFA